MNGVFRWWKCLPTLLETTTLSKNRWISTSTCLLVSCVTMTPTLAFYLSTLLYKSDKSSTASLRWSSGKLWNLLDKNLWGCIPHKCTKLLISSVVVQIITVISSAHTSNQMSSWMSHTTSRSAFHRKCAQKTRVRNSSLKISELIQLLIRLIYFNKDARLCFKHSLVEIHF